MSYVTALSRVTLILVKLNHAPKSKQMNRMLKIGHIKMGSHAKMGYNLY